MNPHSPAPWRIEYSTDYLHEPDVDDLAQRRIYGIADANGHSVVSTDSGYYALPEANARLIAVAPRMLELLRAANLWLSNLPTEEQLDLAAGPEPDQRRTGRVLSGQIREAIKAATE